MMTTHVGMRVLRGPDWNGGDMDGGEGHLGTVVSVLGGDNVHNIRVLWDNGKQADYRSGADGKYDLRIFDTAPVGVRHRDTPCAGCNEKNIYGMLWRCKSCRSCNLCLPCYVTDKHDIKHEFLRYDEPGSAGQTVKKRSMSLKIRAIGIFPGAKVKRGRDWAWADQDGGEGSIGEVEGYENVAPGSSRNIVRVQWPKAKTNSYRLGFKGNVDLVCVEEESGLYYYRDHLPVLSTSGKPSCSSFSSSSSSSSISDNAALFARSTPSSSSISSTSSTSSSSSQVTSQPRESAKLEVGDKVVIHVDEEKLKELQAKYGGCTATMIKCIGKQGEVDKFAANGAVAVIFDKISFRFNPEVVIKVPELKVGDMVRIHSDLEQVKLLNKRMNWKPAIEGTLGKVGQVTKIDSDGDVVVSFGHNAFMYSPACCIPVASSTSFDSVASCGSDNSSSLFSSGGDDLHQDMMRFVGQLLGMNLHDIRRGGGGSGGGDRGSIMQRFLQAIVKGDTAYVRTMCQENMGLVNKVHEGLTPLIVACHEGKKDMCSCLLAQGADINMMGEKGNTPLGAALDGKEEEIAIYLLEKGANPNVRNCKQRNPIHQAAYNNLPEAIKVLAQKGAEVNAKDKYGDTPLHDAIEQENAEAVDMLLRVRSVDLQAQNQKGFNMLQHAALKGNAHATERILARDSGHVDKLLDGQYSALHIAANNDHVDCVKLLVEKGNAEVSLQGRKKLTPLHLACLKGHVRSTEALLEMGAAVNVQDGDGETPLHLVVGSRVDNPQSFRGQLELKNRVRMACILLSKGAYPDLQDRNGREPLECCHYSGFRSAIQQFMRENPEVIKRASSTASRGGSATGRPARQLSSGLGALLQGMTLPCGAPGCMRRSNITLLPCGHKTLCRNCSLTTSECPLCERTIERRIHRQEDGDLDLERVCKQM